MRGQESKSWLALTAGVALSWLALSAGVLAAPPEGTDYCPLPIVPPSQPSRSPAGVIPPWSTTPAQPDNLPPFLGGPSSETPSGRLPAPSSDTTAPGTTRQPDLTPPDLGSSIPTTPPAQTPDTNAGLGAESDSVVGGGYFTGAGYIDSAIPLTQVRMRFDAGYNNTRPDRAEFFYPKCGCFRVLGLDRNAPGPGSSLPKRVDHQDLSTYFEVAATARFSAFIEAPVRWIDIAQVGAENEYHRGFGDLNFGIKYAMIYTDTTVLTFQLQAYAPTGNPAFGLGRNNWAIEPGLLLFHRLADRWFLEAELRDFAPINAAEDFAGNVLRYGAGLSYLIYDSPLFRVASVTELVAWSVLGGKKLTPIDGGTIEDAAGDNIVNAKFGLRLGFGQALGFGLLSRADMYVGYGRALTGDWWYRDMLRVEMRYRF